MGFAQAIGSGFANFFTLSGRAPRSEYWFWALFSVLLNIAAAVLDASALSDLVMVEDESLAIAQILVMLIVTIPSLTVAVRRLHDIDRSGWWLLVSFVPVIGWLVLLVWSVKKGDADANRFGPPHPALRG